MHASPPPHLFCTPTRIHVHCFTDSPDFARRLLDHFPNIYIGITGIISYTTNLHTAALVHHMTTGMAVPRAQIGADTNNDGPENGPRILLETDAPYMVPSIIYATLPEL